MIYKQAQIEKFCKKPDESLRGFLIYGPNEGLVAEYAKQIVKSISPDVYDPFQVVYFNCGDLLSDIGALFAEYSSQSLMGGRRVVVIKDADNNLTKHLKALLEMPFSDTLLVVSSTSLNKKSSLVALAEGSSELGVIACYDDRDEDIFATVKGKLAENGYSIGNEALQLLCSRFSNDRKTNLGEIEKLITFMGDKKNITSDDVLMIISDASSSSSEDVCFFAATGEKEKTLRAFQKMINEGNEPISIVRSLTYHFNKLLTVLSYMENGETIDRAMGKLIPRIIFYREGSFKRQLNIWNKSDLLSVMELLYKCERDCKTTNMPVEEIVSYTLMQIASKAARLLR